MLLRIFMSRGQLSVSYRRFCLRNFVLIQERFFSQ